MSVKQLTFILDASVCRAHCPGRLKVVPVRVFHGMPVLHKGTSHWYFSFPQVVVVWCHPR